MLVAGHRRNDDAVFCKQANERRLFRLTAELDLVPFLRVTEIVVVLAKVVGPEKRHIQIMFLATEHVGRSDARVLLGQAPMLNAGWLAVQRKRGDIADGPQAIADAHAVIDTQRLVFFLGQ